MKRKILFIVCILLIVVSLLVACDRTPESSCDIIPESCKDIYAGKQLVDAYGVVKKPIADPDPHKKWDQKNDNSYFTVDEDFRDNQVGITLTNSESLNNLYYTYSVQDFPGYGVIEVRSGLSESYLKRFREEYESGVAYSKNGMVHPSKFNIELTLILDIHSKENVLRVIGELIKRKDVRNACPNHIMYPFVVDLTDATNSDNQWGNAKINLAGAWQYSCGSKNVKVGIMDSGVAKLTALVDNLSSTRKVYGYQEYLNKSGYDDDILESIYGESNHALYQDHGTQVAGVVGAKLQGTNGAQGVCKSV